MEREFRGKDISGNKFGRLTVVKLAGFYRAPSQPLNRHPIWLCNCECGKAVEVTYSRLSSGNTKSCGCIHKEQLIARVKKHGHKPGTGPVHPLYYRWYGMIQRCEHPNNRAYQWYGGKGIKVCKRWHNFQFFLDDMEKDFKPGLTIERRDNNKDYCPENCYWATWEVQRQTMTKRGNFRGKAAMCLKP